VRQWRAKNTTRKGLKGKFFFPLVRVGEADILHNKSYNDSFGFVRLAFRVAALITRIM
jgi:hypothetical protein